MSDTPSTPSLSDAASLPVTPSPSVPVTPSSSMPSMPKRPLPPALRSDSRKPSTPTPVGTKPVSEYTREELLWYLRTSAESSHRQYIELYSARMPYAPSIKAIDCLPEMDQGHFKDTCNKSVHLYVPKGFRSWTLRLVIHNYVYRRWFRPYRSVIESGRYLCKIIHPSDLPAEDSPSPSTVDALVHLNGAICSKVEARRRYFQEQIPLHHDGEFPSYLVTRPEFYLLQPLFRALFVVAFTHKYGSEDSYAVGKLPVLLVRTGIEEGLSAPITFEPIADKIDGDYDGDVSGGVSAVKTTLETAIGFVMDLEARETAAFGIRPDPAAAWGPYRDREKGELADDVRFWKELRGEDDPLVGPCSQWVDTDMFPEWLGAGEDLESRVAPGWEKRMLRVQAAMEKNNSGNEGGENVKASNCRVIQS